MLQDREQQRGIAQKMTHKHLCSVYLLQYTAYWSSRLHLILNNKGVRISLLLENILVILCIYILDSNIKIEVKFLWNKTTCSKYNIILVNKKAHEDQIKLHQHPFDCTEQP